MICRCIETEENYCTKGKLYDVRKDGRYFLYECDGGGDSTLTKEQFELYFEVIK